MRYIISVPIECETLEQADQVAAERLGYDEDYGFDYQFGQTDVHPVEYRSELVRIKHLPADDAGHPHRIRVMWKGQQYTEQFDHAARDAVEHAVIAALGCTRVEYVETTRGSVTYKAIWE